MSEIEDNISLSVNSELTQRIKKKALELGFSKVGIAPMRDYPEHAAEAKERGGYSIFESNPNSFLAGCFPSKFFPQGKSVICTTYGFGTYSYPKDLTKHLGRTYLSRAYTPLKDSVAGKRLADFQRYLGSEGMEVYSGSVEIPVRPASLDAGIASWGSNNFIRTEEDGSFIVAYAWLVDTALDYDKPTPNENSVCPNDCQLCVSACPTGALTDKRKLDPTRCILYANIGRTDDVSVLKNAGSHLHGCDICQEVCPKNRDILRHSRLHGEHDPVIDEIAKRFDLEQMLMMNSMESSYYLEVIKPIMYNYIKDIDILRRNAAIAMGNSKDPKWRAALKGAIDQFPNTRTEKAAKWALSQINES